MPTELTKTTNSDRLWAAQIWKEIAKIVALAGIAFAGVGIGIVGLRYADKIYVPPSVQELQGDCDAKYKSCSTWAVDHRRPPQ